MPTRKISDREKLTLFARSASDTELDEAFEILAIERRVRAAGKKPTTTRTRTAAKKPADPSASGSAGSPPSDQ